MGLLGALLVVLLILRAFPSLVQEEMRDKAIAAFFPTVLVLISFLAYELGALMLLRRWESSKRRSRTRFLYFNTLAEISLVTACLLATSWGFGLSALLGAPPLVYFLFLSLSALSINPRLCLFAGLLASVEFFASNLMIFAWNYSSTMIETPLLDMIRSPHLYVLKSAIIFSGGVCAAFVAWQIRVQLASALNAVEERDRTINVFGQHVSPQVAELLLSQTADFSGQERRVCVMFADIRNFSQFAAEHSPTEVMTYLNDLFGPIIPLVSHHQGIINKFLGDGFMAVFASPNEDAALCQLAVDAAKAILQCVDELNRNQRLPPTRLGIGIHLGVAITGNVGSGDRKEYTVIGDVVNLASRIEQATKLFHAQLIVSEAVARALPGLGGEDLNLVELKGQPQPVRLFKLA